MPSSSLVAARRRNSRAEAASTESHIGDGKTLWYWIDSYNANQKMVINDESEREARQPGEDCLPKKESGQARWIAARRLGADGADDSAVESFTWGRLKASLSE